MRKISYTGVRSAQHKAVQMTGIALAIQDVIRATLTDIFLHLLL